jgi:hypothetical protein
MLGPDHEAIIRFGGVAPRQRAHSVERFNDHAPARVTTTSDRLRQPPDTGCRNLNVRFLAEVWSDRLPQHDAVRDFAGGDHAPKRDEQLAGESDDHLRLARPPGTIGPAPEPLSKGAVFLKQKEAPRELDQAAAHPGIARFGETFLAPL